MRFFKLFKKIFPINQNVNIKSRSKQKANPKTRSDHLLPSMTIIRALPVIDRGILFRFSDNTFGLLRVTTLLENFKFDFISNPQKLMTVVYGPRFIEWRPIPKVGGVFNFPSDKKTWKGEGRINLKDLWPYVEPLENYRVSMFDVTHMGSRKQTNKNHFDLPDQLSVYISVFDTKTFRLGKSWNREGGSTNYTVNELFNLPSWKDHFEQSGCKWAIEIIEANASNPELVWMLIDEIKRKIPLGEIEWG